MDKVLEDIRIVVVGAGFAGYGIVKILIKAGIRDIVVLDSKGALFEGRTDLNSINDPFKCELAKITNKGCKKGVLLEVISGKDVLIGVSGKGMIFTKEMISLMISNAIVFALSNPTPEINPYEALAIGAKIVATGRSDYPNQVNNALVFPSMLRALLDTRVKNVDESILVSVAFAIANLVDSDQLNANYIVPNVADPRLFSIVIKTLRDAISDAYRT